MPFVRAGSITIRYQVSGSGPPLVMLAGLGRCLDHWSDLEPILSRSFTTISCDLRGSGGTDAPVGFYSTKTMAEDVFSLLDAIGLKEPVHLLGFCLGGMVAQQLAIYAPKRLSTLILGATSPGGPSSQPISAGGLGAWLLSPSLPTSTGLRLTSRWTFSAGFIGANPHILDRWHHIAKRWPLRHQGMAGQLYAIRGHDTLDQLEVISHPTLILHGDSDRLVPPANATILASQIPNAQNLWLPRTGHELAAECPEKVGTLVQKWIMEKSLTTGNRGDYLMDNDDKLLP